MEILMSVSCRRYVTYDSLAETPTGARNLYTV